MEGMMNILIGNKALGDYTTLCRLCDNKITIRDSKDGLCPACHYDLQEKEDLENQGN